jgi:hypothetical protein
MVELPKVVRHIISKSCIIRPHKSWLHFSSARSTFHSSGLAASHADDSCELFVSVWLWAEINAEPVAHSGIKEEEEEDDD